MGGSHPPQPHTGTPAVQKLSLTLTPCTPQNSLRGVRAPSSVCLLRSLSPAHMHCHCDHTACARLCRHLGLLTSASPVGSEGTEVQREARPCPGSCLQGRQELVSVVLWSVLSRTRARVQGGRRTVLEVGICPPQPPTADTGHLGTCGHLATAEDQRFAWLTRLCETRGCFSEYSFRSSDWPLLGVNVFGDFKESSQATWLRRKRQIHQGGFSEARARVDHTAGPEAGVAAHSQGWSPPLSSTGPVSVLLPDTLSLGR